MINLDELIPKKEPAKTMTIDDLNGQIMSLMQQVSELQMKINTLAAQPQEEKDEN